MKRRLVQLAIGLVTVVAAYLWLLPQFADYGDVAPTLRTISGAGMLALATVGTLNLLAPAAAQSAALPGLSLRRAAISDWATTAVTNTVPGGSALAIGMTFAMYRSWRLHAVDITRAVVVTGVFDNAIKLATPALALVWLSTEQPIDGLLVQAAVVGGVLLMGAAAILAAALGSDAVSDRIGRAMDLVKCRNWVGRARDLRRDTLDLLSTRGWALAVWTVAGHLNLYLLLLVCLRVVGVAANDLSPAAILAALAFGRLATAIPLTPGGLGVMEVSLSAALDVTGSADESLVLSAVLLFRFLTYLLPIPLGLISWSWWSGRLAGNGRASTH